MGIRLKDLSKLGYRDNVARSLVVDIVGKYCKHDTKEQIAMTLSNILEHPESYKNNEIWSKLAERLSPTVLAKAPTRVRHELLHHRAQEALHLQRRHHK